MSDLAFASDRAVLSRRRRVVAAVVIFGYLTTSIWYAVQQLRGDPGGSPFGYFWTWDMFPFYSTERIRHVVLAEDATGRIWKLSPGLHDQFRWGVHGLAVRPDLELRSSIQRRAAERAVVRFRENEESPRLLNVALYEQRSRLIDGPLAPDNVPMVFRETREYWSVKGQASIDEKGRLTWQAAP